MNRLAVEETQIEGRHSVLEAIKKNQSIDKLYIQKDQQEGSIKPIISLANQHQIFCQYVPKNKLDQMSTTGRHQGVIAKIASYHYSELEDIFEKAATRDEAPFIIICDGLEDPHNLGAIIRTANQVGVHGVIIPKNRSASLNATVARASAGAILHTPVVRVTNLVDTIKTLKSKGVWVTCADMDGEVMYRQNLKGSIALVMGNEGKGVSRLVKENCDFVTSIPMKGDIDSLNVSVACGVLVYEIFRQRTLG